VFSKGGKHIVRTVQMIIARFHEEDVTPESGSKGGARLLRGTGTLSDSFVQLDAPTSVGPFQIIREVEIRETTLLNGEE